MEQKKTLGLMTVTGCYVLWGILAIFWRFLAQVNSVYVLAQRIIWSLVFMGLYLLFTRRGRGGCGGFPRPKNHGQLPAVRGSHYPQLGYVHLRGQQWACAPGQHGLFH